MDSRIVDTVRGEVADRGEVKSQLKERGLTVSNLLIRAQRMSEEVTVDVDFHKFNNAEWKAEKPRWGQKRWEAMADCVDDVNRLNALRQRVLEASRACDEAMRFDLTFDEVCAALEKTAIELEAAVK